MIKYDFEDDFGEEPEEPEVEAGAVQLHQVGEISPNLHVVKCCGNCKYFTYYRNTLRRGWCVRANLGVSRTQVMNIDKNPANFWPRRHITNSCDMHLFSTYSLIAVLKYTNLKFDNAGMLEPTYADKKEIDD